MGEGGAMVSPPTVFNAICDALVPFGVIVTEHPLDPSRVLSLLS
jgi:carbon-monoxide dehydrogenase large subunit